MDRPRRGAAHRLDAAVRPARGTQLLGKKLDSNMDAEIMQVLLEEARESYDEEIVVELRSDCVEDLDENAERVKAWVETWTKNNAAGEAGEEDEGE